MNELAFRLHMKRQTFHLSINFADRFLEKIGMPITVDKLQLIGITAMSIGSKQEERMVPSLEVFKESVDNAYTLA